jgi:NADH:ubiquinone oxidoreductase subunit D
LAAIPVASMRESISLAEQAQDALEKKNGQATQELLQQAKAKWAANKAVERLSKQLAESKLATTAPEVEKKKTVQEPATTGTQLASVTVEEVKPFYMKPAGAAAILGGVAVLILVLNLVAKAMTRKNQDSAK